MCSDFVRYGIPKAFVATNKEYTTLISFLFVVWSNNVSLSQKDLPYVKPYSDLFACSRFCPAHASLNSTEEGDP